MKKTKSSKKIVLKITMSMTDTGLWVVQPETTHQGMRHASVIHVDSIVCGAHLLPRFPSDLPVYREINYMNALDIYASFYVNKFIDHHAFEIAF